MILCGSHKIRWRGPTRTTRVLWTDDAGFLSTDVRRGSDAWAYAYIDAYLRRSRSVGSERSCPVSETVQYLAFVSVRAFHCISSLASDFISIYILPSISLIS